MLIIKDKDEILKQKELKDFACAFKRADSENPSSEDVAKVKKMLIQYPQLWKIGEGLSGSALYDYICRITKSKSQQLLIEAEAKDIKEQLGYSASNQIEKLIIDQILFCLINIIHIERRFTIFMTEGSHSTESGEYWQNTLTRSQNRYLRAIETLARVRKLNKDVAFQVNIATDGGQQVNVNEVKKEP